MPKVSVIVPIYNVEKYIAKCLESLVNQTLEDIQIILVNDGSTDNSGKIAKQYASKYLTKIIYVEKENGGLSDARNYGLRYATGDYISFVDADDYVNKDLYSNLINYMNNDYDMTKFKITKVNLEGDKIFMKIEEIIAKCKEEGKNDEEIKAELELMKKDIDAYLGNNEGEEKDKEVEDEIKKDEEKMHEVFGI